MAYDTEKIPQEAQGGKNQAITSDNETQNLLTLILKELRIMNIHLSIISDNEIDRGEL
jgi:hypothetical protein